MHLGLYRSYPRDRLLSTRSGLDISIPFCSSNRRSQRLCSHHDRTNLVYANVMFLKQS